MQNWISKKKKERKKEKKKQLKFLKSLSRSEKGKQTSFF